MMILEYNGVHLLYIRAVIQNNIIIINSVKINKEGIIQNRNPILEQSLLTLCLIINYSILT